MIRILTFLAVALVAAPAYSQCVGAMQRNSNLSDTCSASTARSNLGANNATNLTTGTIPAARLPAPAASAFGGVQSLAATSNNFLTGLGTDGIFTRAQPTCANLSGVAASCATDATNATNISSGTLSLARFGNQSANLVLAGPSSGGAADPTYRALVMADLPTAARTVAITFIIDGGGSAITTGIKGDIEIPFACTITAARVLLDQSGSIVVDIWKDTYANYPPTGADSITASAKPTVSSATKAENTTLTGWTTAITAGNILRFNVDSITTATRATVSLTCVKS